MEMKEIRTVIDLMTRNKLSEFELEKDDFKIKIKKASDAVPVVNYAPAPTLAPTVPTAASPTPQAVEAASAKVELPAINSPMVGTFYRSPSPESVPFIDVGSLVTPETVVCIIEAMKVMNEIKAETTGVIAEVLVENGKPVEFGQPLFRLRAS